MRIVFYTGKGGVGKSTMAAAAAWQLSQRYRVLVVSLDPAHNLGDVFGVNLRGRRKRFTDNLHLEEVDLKKLTRAYLKREVTVLSETYHYLQVLNLDSYFSVLQYSPGIEEYALLTSIEKTIREDTRFDYILFDTPPTGLTLRFLALPQVTITWIERLTAIRRQILKKRFTIQKIRGTADTEAKSREIVLNYREDDDDILKRLKALHANYVELNRILQGRDCGIVLVFNPDLLSLRESERLLDGLKELKLPLRLLIQNKVTGENRPTADRTSRILREKASPGIPLQRVGLRTSLPEDATEGLYALPEDLTIHLIPTEGADV
ncbi:MAG: anion transporter [Deltaproteobacteria bacterium HGW-Deltaproteobacteria-19]|jgi:arsenite-transporting ATPase|nr:MAG: anion transporter [Deltaproteobacteria bacterium HGW-Deltaproteobacteria-19]